MKKMRKAKVITTLSLTVVMLVAMTGIAAANPETIQKLQDGAPPDVLQVQPWIINNDGSNNDMDLKFSQYLSCSQTGETHTLAVTVVPIGGGAAANDLTVTLTERSGGASAGPTQGGATLVWNQDAAGSSGSDYIDVTITSTGSDGAQYNLNFQDSYTCGGTMVGEQAMENQEVHNIPEFATIAIPVAAILGLVLFFNHRKHKKE
jgi:hypothetical protein